MAKPVVDHEPHLVMSSTLYVALHATTGGLAGWAFKWIHPVGGTLFGAIYSITDILSNKLLDHVFDNSSQGKCWKFAISFFANIALAAYLTTLAGYTFTFMSGVGLVAGMLAVTFGLQCIAQYCPCLGLLSTEAHPRV